MDGGDGLEKLHGLRNRHLQHLGNIFALVAHLQGFPIISGPVAHLAGHVHVGEEIHFYLQGAIALAGLAPATFHVEGEPAGLIAPHFGLGGFGKQSPNLVEHPGVCCGV